MNDDQLSELFARADATKVDENARKRAVNLAVAEFARAQEEALAPQENAAKENNQKYFQGLFSRLRLISGSHSHDRRTDMKNKKMMIGGFAGVALSIFIFLAVDFSPVPTINSPEKATLAPVSDEVSNTEVELPASEAKRATSVANSPKPETELREQLDIAADGAPQEAMAVAEEALVAQKSIAPAPALMRTHAAKKERAPGLKALAPDYLPAPQAREGGRDSFQHVEENSVKVTREEPVSTFSVDVDTASYSFVRSMLNRGVLPQKDAVRIEEMVNYFDYAYPLPPQKSEPFKATVTVSDSPWAKDKKLLHIGIKGYQLPAEASRKSNLVFLLDVSGSMNDENKLPLVKQSLGLLLDNLQPEDKVSIVVYAGAAGTVLEPTPVKQKQKILNAMNSLESGGSTAGGEGIRLAYQLAEANFNKDAVNRIFLATDGDFNVGITNREELKGFIERKRQKGIYLSVLGFGQGNYQDDLMQALAQNGNGVAAYIDTLGEAQKVLVTEASSTLFPIAKDVKIQFEFNPATVAEYRLIGYETRHLNREDFNNDKVDAGDIGAGHRVTAIYEITPVGSKSQLVDESRYGPGKAPVAGKADEYGFLKIRYKLPAEDESKLMTQAVPTGNTKFEENSLLARDTKFATAVAGFAQLLKGSKYIDQWSYDDAINLAQSNKGEDEYGYRTEFVQLIRKAKIAKAM